MSKPHDDNEQSYVGRREFMAAAAGIAATVLATREAGAAGHASTPADFAPEDRVAKPVGAGSRILITGANRGLLASTQSSILESLRPAVLPIKPLRCRSSQRTTPE
jgi:hypothetical protein